MWFNPFRTQEMHFLKKKSQIFFTTSRACETIVLVGPAPEIDLSDAEFHALSNGS